VSHRNHKRIQQKSSDTLLFYLYNRYMVHVNKYAYSNIYALSISLPYYFYKINMFPNITVLDLFTIFQTYNLISCDISCDCGHVPVTNFIQLVSPQPVNRFSQTKLRWKAPNEGYPHICGMYKCDNKRLKYQDISSCKSFVR